MFISKVEPTAPSEVLGCRWPSPLPHGARPSPTGAPRGPGCTQWHGSGTWLLAGERAGRAGATHQEAVSALLRPCLELVLLVLGGPTAPGIRALHPEGPWGRGWASASVGAPKEPSGNPCDHR